MHVISQSKKNILKCKFCRQDFSSYISSARVYCSASCRSKDGNFGQLERHTNWKGDEVGYWGIHKWIIRHYGKPTTCSVCKKTGLTGRQIHWSNLSHQYKRDISDWARMCQPCHWKYHQSYKSLKD